MNSRALRACLGTSSFLFRRRHRLPRAPNPPPPRCGNWPLRCWMQNAPASLLPCLLARAMAIPEEWGTQLVLLQAQGGSGLEVVGAQK